MLAPRSKEPNDVLLSQAEQLVDAARVHAITTHSTIHEIVPRITEIKVANWDFFLTVAAVFAAATRLANLEIGEAYEERLMEVIARRLHAWDGDAIRAFEDCKAFFERTYNGLAELGEYKRDPHFLSSDALGGWIVWNLFGRPPHGEHERRLVRVLGAGVTHAFYDWWGVGE